MDFSLSQEERLFVDSVREFVQRHIAPRWVDIDEGRVQLRDIVPKMAEAGLSGFTLDPKFGGSGGTFTMAALAAEEIAYADPSLATAVYFLLECAWPFIVQQYGRGGLRGGASGGGCQG